jgi:AcrR family transcriptional regulator
MSPRADAQKNRAHLLSVARKMVAEGELEPSFNELARRAGVGVGTVYRHFADHAALLAGLGETLLADFAVLVAEAHAEKDPFAAVERVFRGAVALVLKGPAVAHLLAAPESVAPAVAAELGKLHQAVEAIVARARRAGVLRSDVKPGDLRRLVCGLELAARSGERPQEAATRFVDVVLAGWKRS